jgi:opacity protein-like surface antigen
VVAGVTAALVGVWTPASARGETDATTVAVGAGIYAIFLGALCAQVPESLERPQGDPEGFDRRGWLAGLRGSYALQTFEDDVESELRKLIPSASVSVDDSFAISGHAGYRCDPRVSADVQVEWIEEFDADASVAGLGTVASITAESLVVTANAKGYLLTGRFQPFLLFGLGGMTVEFEARDHVGAGLRVSEHEEGFATRFGGGLDVYATKNLVVTMGVDYLLPFGKDVEDFDFLSIGGGVEYRF